MKQKLTLSLLCLSLLPHLVLAQGNLAQRVEKLEKKMATTSHFKLSGYLQTQAQWGEPHAKLNIGAPSSTEENFSRIGIRRGHLKLTYEHGGAKAVVQLDATERKLGLKDAYFEVSKDWTFLRKTALRFGVFDRPFGYEIAYSSAHRESPERAKIFPSLFPNERDLGGMLSLESAPSRLVHLIKLEAGLFAGNGINPEFDSRLDFIGRLSVSNSNKSSIHWSIGTSYYRGSVLQATNQVYSVRDGQFVLTEQNAKGEYARREYFGLDAQLRLKTTLGTTHLRAEYIGGQQPSEQGQITSPTSKPYAGDTYLRSVVGGYVIGIHHLPRIPLAFVVKYDWFDPNTMLSTNQIGLSQSTSADIARQTLGLGLLYDLSDALRLQGYYDFNFNETSEHLKGYDQERSDDLFTLRLQYKF